MRTEGEEDFNTVKPWDYIKGTGKAKDKFLIYEAEGEFVASLYSEEHARHIVTAVNSHEELVGLVEQWKHELENECFLPSDSVILDVAEMQIRRINAVLAKARGES